MILVKEILFKVVFITLFGFILASCNESKMKEGPHIVFVTGDEEYRSEESMPMLARILKRELNAKITMCYALDSLGNIDPNRSDHINNLSSLDSADLMVMFIRFRNLPKGELQYILNYVESGKPIVGFRTSTHAFLYKDSSMMHMNNEWPIDVFGQQWITHHGHFSDGDMPLTEVFPTHQSEHIILSGVEAFDAYSWLYHVDGGDWRLNKNCVPFLEGRSLKSNHAMNNRLEEFPITNPVAWTNTITTNDGVSSRVFFTTLGHPFDFKISSMRKLALNGIYWALGKEALIPSNGVNDAFVGGYNPNNSGFGDKFKKGVKPVDIKL